MKKLGATVLVKNQLVVNSTGFNSYRPVSRLNHTILRLQEWEIDEITVLNLSHSESPLKDFNSLFDEELLAAINTPLAYGGGITSRIEAEAIISGGCERVVLSGKKWQPSDTHEISKNLGEQSILIHLPLRLNEISQYQVQGTKSSLQEYLENIPSGWGGEVYIKDYEMDGRTFRAGFFQGLVGIVNETNFPILLGGGVRNLNDVQQLMDLDFSKGVMIGNWLNSQELLIPRIKSNPLLSANLRKLNGFK